MKEKYVKALMDMTERFALTSEAQRLKVGCLLYKNNQIISLGVNGQPPGWHTEVCEDEQGNTLPTVRHAEAACLEKLYLSNETSAGAEMFINYSPCLPCSIKIVAAKVSKVYYKNDYRCEEGLKHLKKNGITVFKVEDKND